MEKHKNDSYIIHYKYNNIHYVNHYSYLKEVKKLYSKLRLYERTFSFDKSKGIRVVKTNEEKVALYKSSKYMKQNPEGEQDYRFVYNG